MAADLVSLKSSWLFRARMEKGPANTQEQINWLYDRFKEFESAGPAEVTATAFSGQSASMQHRGPSPQENMDAIQDAIEALEETLAGQVSTNFKKPFAFRFTPAPADALDGLNS